MSNLENSSEYNPTFTSYAGMNDVVSKTRAIIDKMKDGEKIMQTDLFSLVSKDITHMKAGNVKNLVNIFLKECKDVTVEVGRNGGVYKGKKPKKVDQRPRCPTCAQVVRPNIRKGSAVLDKLMFNNASI